MYIYAILYLFVWILFVKFSVILSHGIRDLPFNAWEVYYNVYFGYGDNFNISHMFLLPPENETDDYEETPRKPLNSQRFMPGNDRYGMKESKPGFNIYGDESIFDERSLLDPESALTDAREFNEISKSFLNITDLKEETRRFYDSSFLLRRSSNYYWYCPSCWQRYEDSDDKTPTIKYEQSKIKKAGNIIIAFLVHARYKIKEALELRDLLKLDKRYKLGYLFNRLRRLVYDMQKLYTTMVQSDYYWYMRGYVRLIQSYKTLVRYSVDVRDCIASIKNVYYNEEDPVIITTPISNRAKGPGTKKRVGH